MTFFSQKEASGIYTFSSRPRVVETGFRYREPPPEPAQSHHGNIMYDRRVIRGNTHAQRVLPATTQAEAAEPQRQRELRRRAIARRRARHAVREPTPEALEGRQHMEVQTELYLEELGDLVVEKDAQTQTHPFMDRPDTPLFVPVKSGLDVSTQIKEGELFDFEREVQPLLEVLVGKVMEQSLLEVMEEEELASLRAQQRALQQRRQAELSEVQRLQEQERRRVEERERRVAQLREAQKREQELSEKMAARAYTLQHLADLLPSVFTSLRCHGFFIDTVQRDVETNFMPWLMDEVQRTLDKRHGCRSVLDDMIKEVVLKRFVDETP